ncbi:MAG TPA: GntR family transcriptional regulator [Acetobacteraceae bacterium]|jgi:DNA-binding GntR family transcriptional regulator|nr:GntR family transcriptional regulator [Acetobacteraceae bacterium]
MDGVKATRRLAAGPALPVSRALTRSALAARAYDAVKAMILDQEIPPRAHIAIDLLAQTLGVSQTPIREAMARLEGDGLVVREENGRLHVADVLDRAGFEQLYVMRLALEPLAAAFAAEAATQAEILSLRETIAQMGASAGQGSSAGYAPFLGADTAFHEGIARAGGNRFLADAVHHLHSHHRLAFLYRNRGVTDWQVARGEHVRIAEAIAGRDPEQAAAMMRAHIERSREVLRAGFVPVPEVG